MGQCWCPGGAEQNIREVDHAHALLMGVGAVSSVQGTDTLGVPGGSLLGVARRYRSSACSRSQLVLASIRATRQPQYSLQDLFRSPLPMVSGRSATESDKPPSATGDWTMGQAIDALLARINQRNLERLLRSFEAEGDRELVALVSARLAERDGASPSARGSTSRT